MAWDDEDFNDDLSPGEKEEWENERQKRRNHPLLKKAQDILKIVHTLYETADEKDRERYLDSLYQSAIMLGPKIAGALGGGSWQLNMQNAALVRYHASYLLISNHGLETFTKTDPAYIKLLRSEVEEFRELFKEWVSTFKDLEDEGIEDEWGLFLRNP